MTILTLYRGDSSKIKEFKFNKTNKYCLVGQGIYLTNSKRVAETYRTKFSDTTTEVVLFQGPCPNRSVAKKEGFGMFLIYQYRKSNPKLWYSEVERMLNNNKLPRKFIEQQQGIYENLWETGQITAEYTNVFPQSEKQIKVVYDLNVKVGRITVFDFDADYFNANVFNVDRVMKRDEVDLIYDEDILGIKDKIDRQEFSHICQHRGFLDLTTYFNYCSKSLSGARRRSSSEFFTKLRDVLNDYGVIGLEYDGGVRLGGGIHHRAFCIWDEDYVNQHKVETIF